MLANLMFMTLLAAALIGLAQFAWFLRRSRNRVVASDALMGTDGRGARSVPPDGALPEIVGIASIAILAMVLLIYGYGRSGYESAQNVAPPSATGTTGSAVERMTQPSQRRANPADMPNPPTTFPEASGNPTDPTRQNSPNPAR